MNHHLNPKRTAVPRSRPASLRRQSGLTLIEWMVAITIGMVIVAALTVLIAQQSATQSEFEKSSRQIENGRYAMQILNDDIQMAGYYGELSQVSIITSPTALPVPCSTVMSEISAALPFAVQGYDFNADTAGSVSITGVTTNTTGGCINPLNVKAGTDVLVIRRADPASTAVGSAVAGQPYLQTGLTPSGLEFTHILGDGTNFATVDSTGTTVSAAGYTLTKKDNLTVADLRKFLVRIYFVSPCSVPASGGVCGATADGGRPIPTLKVAELGVAGGLPSFSVSPLVEGIENLQIDYGFDSSSTGDGSPDGSFISVGVASPTNDAHYWGNLMAIRVTLLSRNNESSPDYVDNKTYALGYKNGASATAQTLTIASGSTDSYGNNVQPFKRRLFSQVIRLVNPSGRRDK